MKHRRGFSALFLAGILLVVPVWLGFGRSGASPNNDTLSAYYKLDESTAGTAADSSGDGNPGTVTGATASTDVPTTVFGNSHSLSFDGNDYVEVPSSAELNPSDLTVSAWVKFNTITGIHTIVGKWDVNYQQQYVLQIDSGGNLHFFTGDGSNVTSDSITYTASTLTTDIWYHVVGTITGTTRCVSLNGTQECDTAATTLGSSANPLTIGAKQNNDGPYFEYLDGLVDDVRVYSRVLSVGELADLDAGNHTGATWDGSNSSDYETAANWDVGVVPDPYTYVTIADSTNQPNASANIAAARLTINSGARLNLAGYNLGLNDSGSFTNNGTLQLKNSETLSSFTNDTDSGTILLTPDSDITGLKTGSSYNNLIINDGTFAHWPLDETSGSVAADMSGFEREAAYQGAPTASTTVPAVTYANDRSLEFNGSSDYASISPVSMPNNATYCAWVRMDAGSGVVLGDSGADQYALKINSGNQIAARNDADNETVSWNISSVYGNWHHICLTQTDNTVSYSLNLYLDGTAVGGTETLSSGTGLFNAIGRGGGSYFDGLIDDVRIYRRNLTPTEIGRLAAGDEPATYTATQTLGANLDVSGNLYIASGRLDVSASNYSMQVGGDLRNDGGVFNARSGTVTLDGANQLINSSMTFYNLSKSVASAATLTFGKDSTTEVTNQLSLSGASGQLLALRSSTPGVEWLVNPVGSETVSYLDIQDSHNIDSEPIDITGANVTDSGNNTNWTVNVAPNTPTALGPSQFINGSFGTDDTPTVSFSVSDANPVDELRYQVQIDNNSDFSSPEVDYISNLGTHGSRSFTVGQNDTDDTYLAGTDDMLMVSGDYYWRVKAIDDYTVPNESVFAVANGGSIAFRLDITGPTTPGTPSTVSLSTNRRPVWTWTASTDTGVGLASPIYTLQWSTDNTFMSGVSAATTSTLTYTHSTNLADGQWYFRVRASDTLGNHSAWATSTAHLIDNTGPTTPVAPFTSSPTGINTPTWSWSAPTDAGIGLAATPYTLNWSLTSNFSSGVFSTTSASNIFTHSTPLGDGTWYMRVKAADALGNESAWSSSGQVLIDSSAPTLPGAPQTADPTNDNTPSWTWDPSLDTGSGLAANPYTVQWSSMSNFNVIAGSTSASSASYTHGTPLGDGTWYIRVSARDVLGNQSGYSASGEVTIDTVAPDVPNAPTTTTPTNDSTPSWTWNIPNDIGVGLSATPYEIEWSQDNTFGTVIGSETLGSNNFTHSTPLAEGTWYFRVRASDAAGNTSSYSTNGSVVIDLTPPTVPGDPSTADPVPDNTPTWTWTVSTDSGVGLASPAYEVQWSTDNTFTTGVSSDTASSATYTHSAPLADGTWYLRVRAVDAVTNQSAYSNAGQHTIDVNPPTVPGTPTTTTPSADNTPSWTWTASTDAGTGLAASPYMIEWSQDEDFLAGVESDTIADANFTHTDPLADGTWYFRVRAQDQVGNISNYSPVGEVFVDALAPTSPGTPSTASPTNDETPTWTWSASTDSGIGLANPAYTVEWSTFNDFSSAVQSTTAASNTFTHASGLTDGTWYFRVRATDGVGNVSADSATGSVVVDDTPPSVPGQPTTATPTNDNTPTWTWSASTDNGVGLADPEYGLQWSLDSGFGSGVFSATSTTSGFTHSSSLADGTWYFRVRASDNLGNTSAFSTAGNVLVSTAGPTIPGDPVTTHPTTDTTPTWTWDASTAASGLANPAYYVEWSQDEDFLSGVVADTINTNTFTHTDPLADGVWYFRVRAEDNTGTFSLYSNNGSVRVDTTAPTQPGLPSAASPTSDTTPTWTWTASTDGGVGLAAEPYVIEWSTTNDFSGTVLSGTASTASFTHTDPLADGTWYFRARARDGLTNTSTNSNVATIVVDATGPTTPGTPSTTTPTNDQTPTWTWTASTDSGVGLDDPSYQISWSRQSDFSSGVSSDTTNSLNFTHTTNLADGTWHFRVRAVDAVGNLSSHSANGQVVVDSSPPTTPGTPTVGVPATNDDTPTWTWTASTDSGVGLGSPAYSVQWSQDSNFISGVSSATAASATYTHSVALSAGTWHFRVRAVDGVTNQSGYSASGQIFVDTDTPTSPGTPSVTTSPTADNTPTWTWDPSTDGGFGFGDDPYEVQWSQDSGFGTGVSDAMVADETFTHASGLADGTWYFRVRAVDEASNTSPYSSAGSVVIDASAPTAPANLSTTTPTKNPTPTWTWDVSTDSGVGLADPAYEIVWSKTSDFSSGVNSATINSPTFTHTINLDFGTWYFRVRAVDNLDNKTAWVSSSAYIDNDPPVMGSIVATANTSGATIQWTTDEVASSQVKYGPGNQLGSQTVETDTSPRVQQHTVVITALPSCSTFSFKVVGEDSLENVGESEARSFTTTGCSGNAAVMGQASSLATVASGGTISLNTGTASLNVSAPSNFSDQDVELQVKQLSPAPALSPIGQPTGRVLVGSHIYDLKAISSSNILITSFQNALTISINYAATEASGFDASSLAIWRHDGTSWSQLSSCTVNTATRTVSCKTNNFSVFGLFGVRATPVETPLPEGEGTVEPNPEPPIIVNPVEDKNDQPQTEAASASRGISALFSRTISTIRTRPAWWIGGLLLLIAGITLFVINRRKHREKHVPYGVHRDD